MEGILCDCHQLGCQYCDQDGRLTMEALFSHPVTDEEINRFEELSKNMKDDEIPDVLRSAWSTMVNGYLRREFRNGAREFRVFIHEDKTFIIHPLGIDGETLDWSL